MTCIFQMLYLSYEAKQYYNFQIITLNSNENVFNIMSLALNGNSQCSRTLNLVIFSGEESKLTTFGLLYCS